MRYGKNYNASATFTSGKQFTPKGNSRTYGVPFTNAQCLIHRLRAVPVEPPKAVGRKASFALESPNNVGSAHTRQGYSPCTSQGNDSLDLYFFRNVCRKANNSRTARCNSRRLCRQFTNALSVQCTSSRAMPVQSPKAVGAQSKLCLKESEHVGSAHTRQGYSPCTSQGNDSLDLKFFTAFVVNENFIATAISSTNDGFHPS